MTVVDNQWVGAGHDNWCSVCLTPNGVRFRVNRPASTVMPFDQACDFTAQTMAKDWAAWPLYVSLSGGLDSELVAEVLLRNHVTFTPVILEVATVNQLETWYAHHWCWRNHIKPWVIKLDHSQYEQQVLPWLAKLRHTRNHGATVNLWLADHVAQQGGRIVTGLCDINFDSVSKQFYNDVMDWSGELFGDTQHPCGFFCYTAEMTASYIKQFDIALNEQYNKVNFYCIPARPKIPSVNMLAESSPITRSVIKSFLNRNRSSDVNWLGTQADLMHMLTEHQ